MDETTNRESGNHTGLPLGSNGSPPVAIADDSAAIFCGADDLQRYRVHITHLGLTPAREAEVLVAIWQMMGSFVDRAFGDDPVQHVDDARRRGESRRRSVLGSGQAQPRTDELSLSDAFTAPGTGAGEESHEH